jgi:hypothetical protein
MNLIKIADRYLADRACCGAYRHHVRTIAGRCRELSTRRVNDYLKARLERVSTITAAPSTPELVVS